MPRPAKPADAVKHSFELSLVNFEHVLGLAIGRTSFASALNTQLEYVRTFGLPDQLTSRLALAAAAEGATLREQVQEAVYGMVLGLPAAETVWVVRYGRKATKRSACNFSGMNHAYLVELCNERGVQFSEALNQELEFARTYGLTEQLLGRLRAHAAERNISPKDAVGELLIRRALAVGDVSARWKSSCGSVPSVHHLADAKRVSNVEGTGGINSDADGK